VEELLQLEWKLELLKDFLARECDDESVELQFLEGKIKMAAGNAAANKPRFSAFHDLFFYNIIFKKCFG